MPFSRPSLSRLIGRAKADIEAELQNGAAYIRRTFEAAIARAAAGLAHTLHGHLDFIARQIIIDTADDEFLVRWAGVWGLTRLPATRAEFTITVTGDTASVPIPLGTRWTRSDGVAFESTAAFALPGVAPLEVTVSLRAVDAGAAGNTIPGTTLTIESPIVGVDAEAVVDGAGSDPIGDGADIESIDALRVRLLERIQTPPKGGGPGDYIAWAKEADAAVTRAWELPLALGPGTVLVLFVQDTFDADGNFISTLFPGASLVDDVDAYIATVAPVTAVVTVQAPVELQLNPSIQLSPNTAAVQEQVIIQLQDLLLRLAEPGTTLELSKINEAISLAAGEEDHVLVSPAADVEPATTELITLGTPVFAAIP